jgi:hypothetical protein
MQKSITKNVVKHGKDFQIFSKTEKKSAREALTIKDR